MSAPQDYLPAGYATMEVLTPGDEAFSEDICRWFGGLAGYCLATAGVREGHVVADFGCGKGRYAIPAAWTVGKTGAVYALDRNEETLGRTRCAALALDLPQVTTINTRGAVDFPLADETVDVVLLYDVLHLIGWQHVDGGTTRRSAAADRRPLLLETRRVLKRNGLLSVFSPHLTTHTDVSTEAEIAREITEAGFKEGEAAELQVLHDDHLQDARIQGFLKAGKPFAVEGAVPSWQKPSITPERKVRP